MTLPQEITDRIENSQRERQQAPTEPMLPAIRNVNPMTNLGALRVVPGMSLAMIAALAHAGVQIPEVPDNKIRIPVKNRLAVYLDVPPHIADMSRQLHVTIKDIRGVSCVFIRNAKGKTKPISKYCDPKDVSIVDLTPGLTIHLNQKQVIS